MRSQIERDLSRQPGVPEMLACNDDAVAEFDP